MLTRIEVDGFKNLVDFSLDLGPYTCIAGVNGVGKSNIFDAIRFLSLLTDHTINQSALLIRSSKQDTGEIGDLFFSANGDTVNRIRFAAEMIVDRRVVDDFGRPGVPSSTFLRYEVAFRHDPPSQSAGPLGGLILEREDLRHIPSGLAAEKLQFPAYQTEISEQRIIYNKRRGSGYISTIGDGAADPGYHRHPSGWRFLRTSPAGGAGRTRSANDHRHRKHRSDAYDSCSSPRNATVADTGAGALGHAAAPTSSPTNPASPPTVGIFPPPCIIWPVGLPPPKLLGRS